MASKLKFFPLNIIILSLMTTDLIDFFSDLNSPIRWICRVVTSLIIILAFCHPKSWLDEHVYRRLKISEHKQDKFYRVLMWLMVLMLIINKIFNSDKFIDKDVQYILYLLMSLSYFLFTTFQVILSNAIKNEQ